MCFLRCRSLLLPFGSQTLRNGRPARPIFTFQLRGERFFFCSARDYSLASRDFVLAIDAIVSAAPAADSRRYLRPRGVHVFFCLPASIEQSAIDDCRRFSRFVHCRDRPREFECSDSGKSCEVSDNGYTAKHQNYWTQKKTVRGIVTILRYYL